MTNIKHKYYLFINVFIYILPSPGTLIVSRMVINIPIIVYTTQTGYSCSDR